uniref:NADH-ubiquinone oxidoreductase chain 6 n=1 Tax=Orgyia postica TaxID=335471 RepID=A0A895KY08_9NEOP|nr:NADH dehydrogenase subunit 6 [Orgyia postica]QRZ60690.1 NADH dehydrogenase subunit 6 [Orgyia postica]
MKLFLSSLIITISLSMMFMNNPLSMGLMILTQTILTCLLSGMLIKTYWFSYILFLIFLGGLLVLFIYVSSITSNELFKPSLNLKMFIKLFFALILLTMLTMHKTMNMNLFFNSDMNIFYPLINLLNNNLNINLNKLYNSHTFLIMIMLMIYLFITLVVVVKITNIFFGPLRSMF